MMPVETDTAEEREFLNDAKVSPTRAAAPDHGMGSALWKSVAGEWVLLKCGCVEGYEAGSPPVDRGKYEGEIVRKLCEPAIH
jgi:hypothetical protein